MGFTQPFHFPLTRENAFVELSEFCGIDILKDCDVCVFLSLCLTVGPVRVRVRGRSAAYSTDYRELSDTHFRHTLTGNYSFLKGDAFYRESMFLYAENNNPTDHTNNERF